MDSFAFWNIRGLNQPCKQFAVKSLFKQNNACFFSVLESRVREVNKIRLLEAFVNWKALDNYSAVDGGRIWVFWNPRRITVTCLKISNQLIHCHVAFKDSGIVVLVTTVYAFNEPNDRVSLWDDIKLLGANIDMPWLVYGDFNTSLHQNERIRNGIVVPSNTNELQSLTMDAGLMDLRFTGHFLTWSDNHDANCRMYCKLDRALVNSSWLSHFDHSQAVFLPPGVSDHSPCVVKLGVAPYTNKHIFRFCNMWVKDDNFDVLVKNAWSTHITGTPMYRVVMKLKAVKMALKQLHRDQYSKISDKVKSVSGKLQQVQDLLITSPSDCELQKQEKHCRQLYKRLVSAELSLLKQKAKVDWLQKNDTNSEFFYSKVKEKHSQSRITSIYNREGELITDVEGVQNEFLNYFQEILTDTEVVQPIQENIMRQGPTVTEDQAQNLCCPATDEEVKNAIFSISSTKSPGPDGFTSGFFKACWHIVGGDVCYAIKDFFRNGKLLKEINATLISLVPKVSCPRLVSDYRPISCCNVIYKVITKIITQRMQLVMEGLIDPAQGAFIKNRSIVDNVLVCQGLVRSYSRQNGIPRCLMKIDLRKAYDTLDWSFLRAVMRGLNFPDKFIQWIMVCVSSPKFSLQFNGSPVGFFSSKRGLRQGDPVSPYLFVLAVEYLSRLFKDLGSNRMFKFHPKCSELQLLHLLFADDMMIFSRADISSPILLMEYFSAFSACSGLRINAQKSHIFFGAVPTNVKQLILLKLGFVEGHLPVRYLGVPLIASMLSNADCNPILEKIHRKLSSWSARCLTYAGRALLISSVIFHYMVYWASIFMIPSAVIKQVDQCCSRFLWTGQVEDKVFTPIAWHTVCLPKAEGGLGVKQMVQWNKAALCKQLWKLFDKPSCLWSKWVNLNYMKGESIWSVDPKIDDPWYWKKLLKLRTIVVGHIQVMVGDGRHVKLFYDNWTKEGPLCDFMRNDCKVWGSALNVCDWWVNGIGWSIPTSFCRKYPMLAARIRNFNLYGDNDCFKWNLVSNGIFTIASLYENVRLRSRKVTWHRMVWTGLAPQKCRFILWMLMHDRLKTKQFLIQRGMVVDSSCLLCANGVEDCQHLFFSCTFSADVWRQIWLKFLGIRRSPRAWRCDLNWYRYMCRGRNSGSKNFKLLLACTIYALWKERNDRLFHKGHRTVSEVIAIVTSLVRLLQV